MKKLFLFAFLSFTSLYVCFAQQTGLPMRERGKEGGMMLDLQKISLGTISNVEEKKQYLSTVQLEKQRIQNYTLRMVYENAYDLYRRGDYQRAQELANVILSIDPSLAKAKTLAAEAGRMATYGTISEQEIVNMKYEEGKNLYKAGRLVEAREKFEEILVIRPYEADARAWVKRVNDDIAGQHTRRGYYAYKNGDYNEALNQWYSVLLIKKDDKDLLDKIAEVEKKMKQEENKKLLDNAFNFYSKGKLEAAYREFEKAMEVQPGEVQTQKYAMQLKKEIADGYYNAGNKAYSGKKYNTAIANWKASKEWGRSPSEINGLIKRAELESKKMPVKKVTKKDEPLGVEPDPAIVPPPILPPDVDSPEPITIPQGEFPTNILTGQPDHITIEAQQASVERYKAGLAYYNAGDIEKAKEEWQAALRLNPNNSDADIGIKNIDARLSSR
ncbi:MAG: tetratricopeptide repeat protein [Elusimicrobiota bacterium]|jgi:tetratricopeptide (TPR) repeat protein|nr:tetratricopeptide repeat protein [Elusimicrobiota bacterium]